MQRSPRRLLTLPLAFIVALAVAGGAIPPLRQHHVLFWSFEGAAAVLLGWWAVLVASVIQGGRALVLDISLRKQHYIQACAHFSILCYWGWYWREVYSAAPLIFGQLLFAYAFDALLSWSRRDVYTFGFGPFPIIFSTNLFLWFKPDWFYLQFLMIAVGFTAKEMIRWTKDGRRTHIFNPSSFTLAIFSLGLLVTGSTAISWGPEIASTQARPPYIYLWIFGASLAGQLLFGVAAMTWAAVATAYGFCLAYFAATGMHFFAEQPIPIAVFLGMHLLFTDPSTAPRTDMGRLIFGVLYGGSVCLVAAILTRLGLPAFYDKLLPVPILNVLIQLIDGAVRSDALRRFDPGEWTKGWAPRARNASYMALWAATFTVMLLVTGTHTALMRADTLMDAGRLDDAIDKYREFVRTDPNEAEGHDKLGVALMQAGRFDEAVSHFERALQLEPSSARAADNLGVALMRAGRLDDAAGALQRAAQLDPANVKTQNNLGVVLMRTGKNDGAIAALRHALELQPANPDAADNLGQALVTAGKTDEGVTWLRRASELQPGNVEARNNLGVALMQAGRFADAASVLERAAALAPNNPEAHDYLGQALLQQGKLDEAIASLQRAVALNPAYADAHFNLAQAWALHHNPREAAAEARAALQAQPDWPLALTELAWLDATERDAPRNPEEAIRLASRAAELTARRDPHVLDVLAAAYASAGRLDEAAHASAASKSLLVSSSVRGSLAR